MALKKVVGRSRRRRAKAVLRVGVLGKIRAYFFAGILVLTPVAVTIALALWFIEFVDSHIVPLIPHHWNPNTYIQDYLGITLSVPGVGVVVLAIVITLVGALTAGFLGRFIVRTGERIVNRMPVVRSIYSASKQILETVFRDQSEAFREAVLVEYPRRDAWTIGFITGQTTGEVQERTPDEVVNVYVPTTPNPTSGFLLYIPVKDVKPLDMSVEDAVKMVISVGMVTPPYNPDAGRRKESLSTLESDPDSPEADNSLETPSET
ncbi:MAG: DUF502 domain-containing protein [Alphaproteobacteria bacterium]|jgi:uncharacterized membrane protein|nr:DUF502 domain-containing protein [Alphaproteobacteria bacterium]